VGKPDEWQAGPGAVLGHGTLPARTGAPAPLLREISAGQISRTPREPHAPLTWLYCRTPPATDVEGSSQLDVTTCQMHMLS
jgi:hypothetical protein